MKNFEVLSEIINNRQSVYPASFTGEVISKDDINKILGNANQAPSHKHTEPWRFHIVSGTTKESYSQFAQKSYKDYIPEEKFKQSKFDKLARKIEMSSHIIMIGCKHDVEANLPKWEEIAAVSCAVQNIYLSATAAGFGGYWSSPGFIIENASKYFKMEKDEVCLGLFYIGIPKDILPPQVMKRNVDDKIKWY